jgi:hypothetical protein
MPDRRAAADARRLKRQVTNLVRIARRRSHDAPVSRRPGPGRGPPSPPPRPGRPAGRAGHAVKGGTRIMLSSAQLA